MRKKINHFNNEDQERDFWSREDSTRYINWKKGKKVVFSNLKPSSKTISLRLYDAVI
ncbi:BrnA antitoxin family protein [bacterium]|nr:BrnA antitoxin family protein [bacterium]